MAPPVLSCPRLDVAVRLIAQVFLQQALPLLGVEEAEQLSFRSATSPHPLRDLPAILQSFSSTCDLLGTSDTQRREAFGWLDKLSAPAARSQAGLIELEQHLRTRTFMVGSKLTAVDLLVYTSLRSHVSSATHQELLQYPCITRHFDFIQNHDSVRDFMSKNPAISIPLVKIDLDSVPQVKRTETGLEKKPRQAKSTSTNAGADSGQPTGDQGSAPPQDQSPATTRPEQDKEKKDQKKGGGGDAKKPAAAADVLPMPHMIDMRVGKIIHVEKHPDADTLYVEKIDFGEPEPRTVVSGLVNYIPIDEMRDRLLVGICNLKPASMRGIKSFAMVLAASSKDGKGVAGSVELVLPPPGSQPGDVVYFEGFENEKPIDQLNPKKKQFEAIQPHFTTLETREACWKDSNNNGKPHRIMTARGVCRSPTLVGASLS